MPNYNLVSNAVFTPFSYERYLQPYEANEKDFREIQDAVANYDDLTSSWRDKIDDSVKDQYDNYYKSLESGRDRLIKEGLTASSRAMLMNIRRGYAKEITPIENAYKLKQEDIKRQQASYDKADGMMVFTNDARNNQLTDYMNGKTPEYQETNLNSVMNEGLAGAKALSSRQFSSEERKRFSGDYNDLVTKQGLNPQEALQVIADLRDDNGNPKYPEFNKLMNDILDKHGYDNYSQTDQAKIMGALVSGINMGIVYNEKEQLYENWRAKLAEENRYKTLRSNSGGGNGSNKKRTPDITAYYFKKDKETIKKLLDEKGNLKYNNSSWAALNNTDYTKYLFKDGKFTMPSWKDGKQAFGNDISQAISYYNDINRVLINMGYSQDAINSMNKETIEENLRNYESENRANVTGRDVYRFQLDENATEQLAKRIQNRKDKLYEITGMNQGNLSYGDSVDLDYSDGDIYDAFYDNNEDVLGILKNGKYYKLPLDIVSKDTRTKLKIYTSPEYKQKISNANDILDYLNEKMSNGTLSPREEKVYEASSDLIDEYDEFLSSVGNELGYYVGTKNINN